LSRESRISRPRMDVIVVFAMANIRLVQFQRADN